MDSALVEKRLILDLSKQNWGDCIWIISDMSACYDRYIQEISKIILDLHRINKNTANILLEILDQMTTYIQTNFRIR